MKWKETLLYVGYVAVGAMGLIVIGLVIWNLFKLG